MTLALLIPGLLMGGGDGNAGGSSAPTLKTQQGAGG